MRVKMNRDVCSAPLSFCERCLGRFLEYPLGYERRCFEELEEDGKEDLTVEIHTDGHDLVMVLDEEQRMLLAGEGWANFVDFAVPMYREEESK